MVVPVDRISSVEKTKKFVGNNLSVSIKCNSKTLLVIGNGCKVDVEENLGHIRIIGDYCKVTVSSGTGKIEYIGNYGKIVLGDAIPPSVTSLLGNEIKLCSKKSPGSLRRCSPEKVRQNGAINKCANINICNASQVEFSLANLPSFLSGIAKIKK